MFNIWTSAMSLHNIYVNKYAKDSNLGFKFAMRMLEKNCSICQETISYEYLMLTCGHGFHRKCLEKWCSVKESCPLCRVSI